MRKRRISLSAPAAGAPVATAAAALNRSVIAGLVRPAAGAGSRRRTAPGRPRRRRWQPDPARRGPGPLLRRERSRSVACVAASRCSAAVDRCLADLRHCLVRQRQAAPSLGHQRPVGIDRGGADAGGKADPVGRQTLRASAASVVADAGDPGASAHHRRRRTSAASSSMAAAETSAAFPTRPRDRRPPRSSGPEWAHPRVAGERRWQRRLRDGDDRAERPRHVERGRPAHRVGR